MVERASWATMNGEGGRIVDVEDARLALGALWTPGSTAVDAREGIRVAGGNPGRVSASSPTPDVNVHVEAFQGVLGASRGLGNYGTTLDADKTIDVLTATPADPSNDRIDLVIEQQTDTFYGDSSTAYEVKLIVGDPAAAPVDPIGKIASPDYRILARVRVPAGATSIDDSDIDNIDQPWTVAAGGVLPIRSKTERDAITDPHDGQVIYRYDRDWIETWTGLSWRVQGVAVCSSTADRDNAITNPYAGQLALLTSDRELYRYTGSAWVTLRPYLHAYQTSVGVQNIVSTTPTAITMTGEIADNINGHSTSSNTSRYTPVVPGKYRCWGQVCYGADAPSGVASWQFNAQFRKNGAVVLGAGPYGAMPAYASGFVAMTAQASATFDMNGTGDFIELFTTHNKGVTAPTFSNTTDQHSFMIIERVGA